MEKIFFSDKQKSRMFVVYRKKRSATRKGKNFLQWRGKYVMIKCSYQNYMTKYRKIRSRTEGLKRYGGAEKRIGKRDKKRKILPLQNAERDRVWRENTWNFTLLQTVAVN